MMKWDSISQKSMYYRSIFGVLRRIQKEVGHMNIKKASTYGTNMQVVKLHIEFLLSEVLGQSKCEYLPLVCLPKRHKMLNLDGSNVQIFKDDCHACNCFDMVHIWFNKTFLFSSCPWSLTRCYNRCSTGFVMFR